MKEREVVGVELDKRKVVCNECCGNVGKERVDGKNRQWKTFIKLKKTKLKFFYTCTTAE